MNEKLIFDHALSNLYKSNQELLKHLSCPQLKSWQNLARI